MAGHKSLDFGGIGSIVNVGMAATSRQLRRILQQEKNVRKECAEPIPSLARALGRMGSKDVSFKYVRAGFRQGYGGTSYLNSVKVLVLIGRQGRIEIGHQRGNGYLIAEGIGGSKQVTNGFMDEVSATSGSPQIDRAMMAALPRFVITETAADVGHLDPLRPVCVIIGVRRETIGDGT